MEKDKKRTPDVESFSQTNLANEIISKYLLSKEIA